MRIKLTSVFVDDQDKALDFYTTVLGFVPSQDIPVGEFRWITVRSPEGEQRLSDFLLYECAFAELHFSPRLWPDFDEAALAEAFSWFGRRHRRFGG